MTPYPGDTPKYLVMSRSVKSVVSTSELDRKEQRSYLLPLGCALCPDGRSACASDPIICADPQQRHRKLHLPSQKFWFWFLLLNRHGTVHWGPMVPAWRRWIQHLASQSVTWSLDGCGYRALKWGKGIIAQPYFLQNCTRSHPLGFRLWLTADSRRPAQPLALQCGS